MPKLNQIVAVVAGKKSDAEKAITELYHKVKKPQLFEGITKTYEAIEVNGEELPSEVKLLQFKVSPMSFRSAETICGGPKGRDVEVMQGDAAATGLPGREL